MRPLARPALALVLAAGGALAACAAPTAPASTGGPGAAVGPTAGAAASDPVFVDIAPETGLDFVHANGMTGERTFVEMMGAGGGFLDYDNDGDLDVLLLQGRALGPGAAPPAKPGARLYRNDLGPGPDGRPRPHFSDVTEAAGLAATGYGMGLAAGDYDNDGWTDLYLGNWGPNQLWRNNGDGTFSDVTAASGSDDPGWTTAAGFLDFDRDGWLDLAVVNYVRYDLATDHPCYSPRTGRPDYCSPQAYAPAADRLLRNRGDGRFEDVTVALGFAGPERPGLGLTAADFDGDGWQDLYVANDGTENDLWINQGGRRFEERGLVSGAAVNREGMPEASMGVAAADVDGDQDLDLFLTHLKGEKNTLYENLGGALFEDRSRQSSLGLGAQPYTAFGIGDLDYDGDGRVDFLVANGAVTIEEAQEAAGSALPLEMPGQLFRNLGAGRFEDASAGAGPAVTRPAVSRAVAVGDVDNDGDPDALLTANNGPVRLLVNQRGPAAWLGARLLGTAGRRDMVGATARREGGPQLQRVHTDGSYQAAGDPRLLFALEASEPSRLVVRWPDGSEEGFAGLAPGRYHTLVAGQGEPVAAP